MLRVGIIGCGNAGNQVCATSVSMYPDIPVIAINCSEKDIQTLPDSVYSVVIGDGKGAGKNREEAKDFLEGYITEFVADEKVRSFLKNLDIVFTVSSTGGGTGSGISILLSNIIRAICVEDQVYPIPIGILSTLSEGPGACANTLSYLDELYDLTDNPTYMIYDNGKYEKMGVAGLTEINKLIVEDINVMRGYYNTATKYNSIDEKDSMAMFTTPGRIFVASLRDIKEDSIVEDNSIEDMLISEIRKNGHANLEYDGLVNYTGVIAQLSESMSKRFDVKIPKVQEVVGAPIDVFEHISINEDRKMPNNIFYIACGLSSTSNKISEIEDVASTRMEARRSIAVENHRADKTVIDDIQKNRVNRAAKKDTQTISKQVDLQSIFARFKK